MNEETTQPTAPAAENPEPQAAPKVEKPERRWYRILLKANPATGSRRKLVIQGAGVLRFRRGQTDPSAEDCQEQTVALFPEQALRVAANPDFSVLPGARPEGKIRKRTAHDVTPAEPLPTQEPEKEGGEEAAGAGDGVAPTDPPAEQPPGDVVKSRKRT